MAHAYTPEAIIRCVQLGVKSIEHGNLLNEEAALAMAEAGAYLSQVHAPLTLPVAPLASFLLQCCSCVRVPLVQAAYPFLRIVV